MEEEIEPGIIGYIERSLLHDRDKLEYPSAPLYPNLNQEIDRTREYSLLKEFISQNRDVTKLLLKNLEKPIKSIDIPLTKLNQNGFFTIKIYKNFDYNIWIEMHINFDKEKGTRFEVFSKYIKGFKDLKFTADNKNFYISFKSKIDILGDELKISIN